MFPVDENYVLTAAHCVAGKQVSDLKVLVGEHDFSTATETTFTQTITVLDIIPHASYNSATNENDIALVRVKKMTFNENVGSVCLPFTLTGQAWTSDSVTAAGWGTTSFGGTTSKVLQKVELQTVADKLCTNTMICTYTEDKDTCQYDSGGSLFYTKNSKVYAVGVVSSGIGCAGSTPSVNAKVSAHLDWIKSKAVGATFCNV